MTGKQMNKRKFLHFKNQTKIFGEKISCVTTFRGSDKLMFIVSDTYNRDSKEIFINLDQEESRICESEIKVLRLQLRAY